MKQNNKELELYEVKQLQVEMLIELDKFCRKHNVTYFLGWGSLLGAIRHKGYIPWDDDIDIMIPRLEIESFICNFKSEKYKIGNIGNEPNYVFPFPRLILKNTYRKAGIRAIEHGISIDIYPIDAYPLKASEMSSYIREYKRIQKIRQFLIKIRRLSFKILPITKFPLIKILTKKQEHILSRYNYDTAFYVQSCDTNVPPFPKSLFEERCEVEFEGHKFYAPKDWDTYLRLCYGDYMQLPPEDKRHPYHGTDKYY